MEMNVNKLVTVEHSDIRLSEVQLRDTGVLQVFLLSRVVSFTEIENTLGIAHLKKKKRAEIHFLYKYTCIETDVDVGIK